MERDNLHAYDEALDTAMYILWSAAETGDPLCHACAAAEAVRTFSDEEVREALTEQLASMLRFLHEEVAE